jgi:hypothetical protein
MKDYTKLIRGVNFVKSINLKVRSVMFPHWNIDKYIWMPPDGKPHDLIHNISIEKWRHSSELDVWSFKAVRMVTFLHILTTL